MMLELGLGAGRIEVAWQAAIILPQIFNQAYEHG